MKIKEKKTLNREELEALSKDEIISMIMKLETNNEQLKKALENLQNPMKHEATSNMDLSKFPKRRILIKLCYLGWNYDGFVIQNNNHCTIESYLFRALLKARLITDRPTSNYRPCGRTDKGVSAFSQVVSLDVRSIVDPDEQLSRKGVDSELNYCTLLNKFLPRNIQAICWRPLLSSTYSARKDCITRTYRYFFPKADLNIEKMREACTYLVGIHDFRNFCKSDVNNGVVNHFRRLEALEIKEATNDSSKVSGYDFLYLEIKGSAFLQRMIRCIMTVLLLVGQERESPEIVKELLDVATNDKKPNYAFASEIALNLFSCEYEDESMPSEDTLRNVEMLNKWIYDEEVLRKIILKLQIQWCQESVKSTMIKEMLKALLSEYSEQYPDKSVINSQASLLQNDLMKEKLMKRQKGPALQNRIEHWVNLGKIVEVEN